MTINELATMVHQNAVEHGWWDEERDDAEVNALIHSEWSEALEEARAGRPLVWYSCGEAQGHRLACDPKNEDECRLFGREEECEYRGHKPEGIAVELIDGVIRILDYFGRLEADTKEPDGTDSTFESLLVEDDIFDDLNVPTLVAYLHLYTSRSIAVEDIAPMDARGYLNCMALVVTWVKRQGLDPLAILMEKHAYNKTRPYKHGKKF